MDLKEFASAAHWRRPDQLRGLVRNHPSIVTQSFPLANAGTLFATANLALHKSETALAAVLTPLFGTGSVGLMMLGQSDPSLDGGARRWLELPPDVPATCIDWAGELLFVGSTRGRIFICDVKPDDCALTDGQLVPSGQLNTQVDHPLLKELIVAPSCFASSTAVRSLESNRTDESQIVALEGRSTFLWDLGASALPSAAITSQRDETMLCARWAPNSSHVLATGSSIGALLLSDRRTPKTSVLRLPMPNDMVRSIDFSSVMPWCMAATSAQGSLFIFDCRIASAAVMSLETVQGDAAHVRWSRLNAEMLSTAGADGSLKQWSLRCPPTHNVGTSQFMLPVSDLCMTATFPRAASVCITSGGEVCVTQIADEGLLAIAPRVTQRFVRCSKPDARLADQERQLEAALFTRDLEAAAKLIYASAKASSDMKDFSTAAELISLLDRHECPAFSYDSNLAARAAQNIAALFTHHQAVATFQTEMEECSNRVPSTIDLSVVRGLRLEDPADVRRIAALKANVALRHALNIGDADAVRAVKPEAMKLEFLDGDLCCSAASFLLEKSRPDGVAFVQKLLSMLVDASGVTAHRALVKRLVLVISAPLVVDAAALSRKGRKLLDSATRNMKQAKDAINLQVDLHVLHAQGNHQEIVRRVAAYQDSCIRDDELGVCGWIAVRPLEQYLAALAATSNYVGFFWTASQLADSLSGLPGAKIIEDINFAQIERIRLGGEQLKLEMVALRSQMKIAALAAIKSADGPLRRVHSFLLVLLRIQLMCERVAHDGDLEHPPALMVRILDVLGTITADLLESWTSALTALQECVSQKALVRQNALEAVKGFAARIEELVSLSPEGVDDETIAAVLDVTDTFVEVVSAFPVK
jgi:hypothetical protein